MRAVTTLLVIYPGMEFTRMPWLGEPTVRWCQRRQRLIERRVTVTNPDGSKTERTFWTDGHIEQHMR